MRLVKTIGDAVMLVSPEAAPLVAQALDLVAAAAAEGDQFPVLRAGLATGPTLPQSGDYYGRSVNLASRITGIARPGSVLVDTPTREAAGEDFDYSFAGERRLKGIDSRQKLFRVRHEGERRPGRVSTAGELRSARLLPAPLARRGRGADGGDRRRSGGDRVPGPGDGRGGDRRLPGRVEEHWEEHGFGHWAVEPLEGPLAGRMIGFVGVAYPTFLPELASRPELGWRLARESWGSGYATEAALLARDDAFTRLASPS